MKHILLSLLFYIVTLVAQGQMLVPGDKPIKAVYLKPETNQMICYVQRDTALMEIGRISNVVSSRNKKLYIVHSINQLNIFHNLLLNVKPHTSNSIQLLNTLKLIE